MSARALTARTTPIRPALAWGSGLLALGLALLGPGCAPEDTPSPSPEAQSPTPTAVPATPSPTPGPILDQPLWYRVTTMTVVDDPSVGIDLDDDGLVDNGLQESFNQLYSDIMDQVTVLLCPDGVCGTAQQTALDGLSVALQSVLTTEALSTAMNTSLSSGSLNYLFEISSDRYDYFFSWCLGTFGGTGYVPDGCTAPAKGVAQTDGSLLFGPASLTISTTFALPGADLVYPLDLASVYFLVPAVGETATVRVLVGGAILEGELIGLFDALLAPLAVYVSATTLDQIMTIIETLVHAYCTEDINGDGINEAYSLALYMDGQSIPVSP